MKTYTGHIDIQPEALMQIYVIKKNDYTLEGCEFRIRIDGKGCSGFTYDMGFSPVLDDDFVLTIPTQQGDIKIILDPFTSHYVQLAQLDYEDSDTEDMGFVLTNLREEEHEGKFFEDESKLPNI